MAGMTWKSFELEWRNYPRVRFFRDRYLGLYPRFVRITDALPSCFHDTSLMSDLRSLKNELHKPPTVLILGLTDLALTDLVISASAEQKGSNTEATAKELIDTDHSKVVGHPTVYHETTKDEKDVTSMGYRHFVENIDEVLKDATDKHSTSKEHHCWDVIVFRAPEFWSEEELLEGDFLLRQKLPLCLPEHICVERLWNPTRTELPSQISLIIEKRIVKHFKRMFDHLKCFMRTERRYDLIDNDVLHSDEIFNSIRNIVCNRYTLREIVKHTNSNDKEENKGGVRQDYLTEMSEQEVSTNKSKGTLVHETGLGESKVLIDTKNVGNEHDGPEKTFKDELIRNICKSIICAAVPAFAAKHNLVETCCHKLLMEIEFDERLVMSIPSKNTKYRLSQIQEFAESVLANDQTNIELTDSEFLRLEQFRHIAGEIQHDIETTFVASEKTLVKMERVIIVMRKMAFEIKGYLNQSEVYRNFEDKMFQYNSLPQSIREKLLRIDGVFSVATVYGELEIELTGEKSDERTKKTTEKVESILKDGKYCYPRKFKLRETFPKLFAGQNIYFEQGDKLLSPNHDNQGETRFGTLGMCLQGIDGKSYGMTCAHVVENSTRVVEVHKSGELAPRKFGTVSSDKLVMRFEGNISVLDIAAVSVFDNSKCCYNLLDDTATSKPHKIANFDNLDELIGQHVFKRGATTGFTEGIIKSNDSIFDRNANHKFIVIEALPTWEGERCDSGTYNYLDDSCGSIRQKGTQVQCTSECTKDESLRDSLLDDPNILNEADQNTSDDEDRYNELHQRFDKDTSGSACAIKEEDPHSNGVKSNKTSKDVSEAVCTPNELEQQLNDDEAVKSNDASRPELGEENSAELRNSEMINNSTENTASPKNSTKHIFADEGDSGAIVCMCDLANNSLLVISMVSAGDTNSKDPFCISIPMKDQMDALNSIKKTFPVPNTN